MIFFTNYNRLYNVQLNYLKKILTKDVNNGGKRIVNKVKIIGKRGDKWVNLQL